MNNYKKYLKYKYKYYALKKQIGGNDIITYGDTTIKIDTNSKNDYYKKIHDNKSKSDEEFIKDLIIYYILNTHTNSHNYICPDIKIEIDKINPDNLMKTHEDKSLNNHNTAYRYSYTQSQYKPAKNSVSTLAEEPCGKPIKEQSLMDRAIVTFNNIQNTLKQSNTSISSIFKNIKTYTFEEIKNKIQARYDTIARERNESNRKQHNVLLSDIFFWYVMINKMFIDKIFFFKQFEPNFIETLYSGSWEASSIKQQTLAADKQQLNDLYTKPLQHAPPPPHASETSYSKDIHPKRHTSTVIHPTEPDSYVHPYAVNTD
jgi:hypothetical protein